MIILFFYGVDLPIKSLYRVIHLTRKFMKENYFDIADLIAKYLSKEIDAESLKRLNEWADKSNSNKIIFDNLQDHNYRERKSHILDSINIEEGWRKIIKQEPNLQINDRKPLIFGILKLAAAILLVGLLITTFYKPDHRDIIKLEAKKFDVEHPVQLKLSNGNIIDLTSVDGEISAEEGNKSINNNNDVLIYSQNKDSQKTKDKSIKEETKFNEVSVSFGKGYKIVLSDGTSVYINSLSKISFPVIFPGNKREVFLDGEAYFLVAEDKSRPFIVNTKHYSVEAIGTSFNVSAYSDEAITKTTLVDGAVKVRGSNIKEVVLKPNEQLLYNIQDDEVSKQIVDVSYYIAWTNGRFRFKDIRLEDLMKIVQRLYDVEIIFSDSNIKDYVYGCSINRYDSIEPILRIIEATGKLKTEMKGRVIYIYK